MAVLHGVLSQNGGLSGKLAPMGGGAENPWKLLYSTEYEIHNNAEAQLDDIVLNSSELVEALPTLLLYVRVRLVGDGTYRYYGGDAFVDFHAAYNQVVQYGDITRYGAGTGNVFCFRKGADGTINERLYNSLSYAYGIYPKTVLYYPQPDARLNIIIQKKYDSGATFAIDGVYTCEVFCTTGVTDSFL